MHPQILAEAGREYHDEMRRLQCERTRIRSGDERKLVELQRTIERMIGLVASGTMPGSAVARRISGRTRTCHPPLRADPARISRGDCIF